MRARTSGVDRLCEELEEPDFPIELDWDKTQARADQARESGEFGAVLHTACDNRTHSYAALAPVAGGAARGLERELGGYSARARIRHMLADRLEALDAPERWVRDAVPKLRNARRFGQWGVRLETGQAVVFWSFKAGLSRLCPDDAREESMRLRRRVQSTLEELQSRPGHALTYAVFTMPNSAPGKLRAGMADIFKRFRRLVRSGEFPQITASLAVLEAPLGRGRDWNVHLNVIFVTSGFVDWGKLRRAWHWNVELRRLPREPGAVTRALAELIKYAVAATVSKSEEKATRGEIWSAPAPPMLEWTDAELLEWLRAFHGFRRTRAYGALHGLKAPDPAPVGPVVWLGSVSFYGGRYALRAPLLDSIPEDKSTGHGSPSPLETLRRSLAPGGLRGVAALFDRVPMVRGC